jgi:hypothetical protein
MSSCLATTSSLVPTFKDGGTCLVVDLDIVLGEDYS